MTKKERRRLKKVILNVLDADTVARQKLNRLVNLVWVEYGALDMTPEQVKIAAQEKKLPHPTEISRILEGINHDKWNPTNTL